MFKIYSHVVGIFLLLLTVYGVLLPHMISAEDDFLVVAGIIIGCFTPYIAYVLVKNTIKLIKQLSKDEKGEEQ